MFENQTILAIVPARGGSKGIPRKNLRKIGDISLTGRACALAKSASWIDAVVVSTDDPEIAAEAERHGALAPFLRPEELSGDSANSVDAWIHAWEACEATLSRHFSLSLLLEPTSPLRTLDDIERTVHSLLDSNSGVAATVSPTPAHFTPHKTLTIGTDQTIGFYHPDGAQHGNRHTIPRFYHRNGLCYAAKRGALAGKKTVVEGDCLAVVVERPVVNIDEPFDLELASWLLTRAEDGGDEDPRALAE